VHRVYWSRSRRCPELSGRPLPRKSIRAIMSYTSYLYNILAVDCRRDDRFDPNSRGLFVTNAYRAAFTVRTYASTFDDGPRKKPHRSSRLPALCFASFACQCTIAFLSYFRARTFRFYREIDLRQYVSFRVKRISVLSRYVHTIRVNAVYRRDNDTMR